MRKLALGICFLSACGALHAQTVDQQNAATWYQRAIDQYASLPESQLRAILDWEFDGSSNPPPEVRAALANVQGMLTSLDRASSQAYCHHDLDRTQGFELALPHLNRMRQMARIARADVWVRLHDGDGAAAADRIASLYRMSGHAGDDRIIISSLVGQAVFQMADGLTQRALDTGALDAAQSGVLLEAARQLGVNDPFNYVEAMAGEHEMMLQTFSKVEGEQQPEEILKILGLAGADEPTEIELMLLDQDGFQASLDAYDGVMRRMAEIFANPDVAEAKEQVTQLEAEIENRLHGPLVTAFMPGLPKCLETKLKGEQLLKDRIAILSKIAGGETDPADLVNAAVWYLRGIAMLAQIEPEVLEAVRAVAADASKTIDVDLAKALDAAQPIVDAFRDGSQMRRCDFRFARMNSRPLIAPPYATGMHDALRLLRVDSLRLVRAGKPADAVDRMAVCLRVTGHLGGDPQLSSALIAHHNFAAAVCEIDSALGADQISDDLRPQLQRALGRISRQDPFGYVRAIVEARPEVAKRLSYYDRRGGQLFAQPAKEAAKGFNGDRLLFVIAILDAQTNPTPKADPAGATAAATIAGPPWLNGLGDVFSFADFAAAQESAPDVAARFADGELNLASMHVIPAIAASSLGETFDDHVRRARNDLRQATRLLEPAPGDANPEP